MTDPSTDTPPKPVPPARRRFGLSIQSKLLTMLLGVSIVSVLVTGLVSYRVASDSLRTAAKDKLIAVQEGRIKQLASTTAGLRRASILNSGNPTMTQAMAGFEKGFRQLQAEPVTAAERSAVDGYYDKVFLPALGKNVDGALTAAAFEPTDGAGWYLQSHYTAPYDDFDKAIANDNAGDGSEWSKTHATYHPYLRQIVVQNGYEDAMLVDTDGNVVYTAYKGTDLGANVFQGAYEDSALAKAAKELLRTNSVDAFSVVDYEPYTPSYDTPTIFGLSPIGTDGKLTGILVFQLPIEGVNNVMTGSRSWQQIGLGRSGEAYLVGSDHTMRSTSRLLLTDPEKYQKEAVDQGLPIAVADRIVREKTPILEQTVNSRSVDLALTGKSGTVTETDYLGRKVITAYAPVTSNGLNWVMLAQIDESEALAPVAQLFRILAAVTLGLVLLVTLLSTFLARAFTRPVHRLLDGVRRVAGGDLQARVVPSGRDEFGSLAVAFNDMATSLSTKQDLLDDQLEENDRIIGNLMPETVARRYKEGESNIVEEHQDVSVVYGTIDGLDALTGSRRPEESMAVTNDLVRLIDAAAGAHGLEKVRALRSGYIASCGLVVPRVDHIGRCLEFAKAVEREIHLFGAQHGIDLRLRMGIDTGAVTTGLVGNAAMYDLWGDSVNLAFRVQAENTVGIYVTQHVYDKARDAYRFESAGTVTGRTGSEQVWRLEVER